MTTHKKTTDKDEWVKLTHERKKDVETRMLAAADAHKLASDLCQSKAIEYDSQSYNNMFLRLISFEMLLVSVEQSLRLLLLLLFSIFPKNPNHDLYHLYKTLEDKIADKEGLSAKMVRAINGCAKDENMRLICEEKTSEEELVACLKKHRSSYANTKYFQVNRQGNLSENFGFSGRERQILYCLSVILFKLSRYEAGRHGLLEDMSSVPESEITEEQKALKEEILSSPSLDT